MPNGNKTDPSAHLSVESLEDRTVLSSFGADRGLSVALSNIIPDNINQGNEYITGTGPGTTALVRIWSLQGKLLTSFKPFGNFQGGVFVATGNLDSDNTAELIVSTGAGTTGRVKVFELGFGGFQAVSMFTPFGVNYTGGVDIAVGNVTGGRAQEIVVGQQSAGSRVRVFADIDASDALQFAPIRNIDSPFGPNYTGGVSLAVANLDATRNTVVGGVVVGYDYNYAEILVGKASNEPRIKIFDAQTPTIDQRGNFLAFDTTLRANREGVNLAAGSTDGQRGAEIFVAIKGSTRIRVFSGSTGIMITEVFPFLNTRSQMLNLAIGQSDDDFFDIYSPADLIVVRADGPYEQIPLVFPGRPNSAAGLNGSQPAA